MQLRTHLRTKWPYDYWTTLPRPHLHPTAQPCNYEFTLEPTDHIIIETHFQDFTCIPRLNDGTTNSPWNQMTIWLLNNFSKTSPASDDSTMQLRLHLRTKWPYDYWNTPPRLHLHPTTQPCNYEFTLYLNDQYDYWNTLPRRLNYATTNSP